MRRVLLVLAMFIGFGLGWASHIFTAHIAPAPPPEWVTIRVFWGELSKGNWVVARVSSSRRFSTGESSVDTFLQNRIQLEAGDAMKEFRWSDSESYSAPSAEVVDLDNDGSKEFVFLSARSVRVVSFLNGSFLFREKADEFLSLDFDLAMVEREDGSHGLVKIRPGAASDPSTAVAAAIWNRSIGFVPN